MTAQIAYLPRPVRSETPNLDHRFETARDIMRHHERHPTATVIEVCEFLAENGDYCDQIMAEATLEAYRAADRRRAYIARQPPAVKRRRRSIITEAVLGSAAVLASASFAVAMIVYVLTRV